MILYIAGPMTGLPDYNYPAFEQARASLEAAGYRVLCQSKTPDTVKRCGVVRSAPKRNPAPHPGNPRSAPETRAAGGQRTVQGAA
jgi:hypothetical protein